MSQVFRGWRADQIVAVTIVVYSLMDWAAPSAWLLLRMLLILSEIHTVLQKYGVNPERLRVWSRELILDFVSTWLLTVHVGVTIGSML